MKEYILGEENVDEENRISQNLIRGKKFYTKIKNKFNYQFLIIVFSTLDFIAFLLFIIFAMAIESWIFWLFLILTIIFSITLAILIISKIKNDKNEKEEENRKRLELEEENRKRLELEEENRKKLELEEEKRKQKEEEEKLKEMKIKMLENQKKLREQKENSEEMTEQQIDKKVNNVLEDMCIYGEITKKEIIEEKEKHPEKFIETSEALKLENEDEGLFALGLISQNLEELGIETAIEKDENQDTQDVDSTSLQFITNGMINKKKYDLHFELGEERNEEILKDKEEFEKF